MKPLFLKLVKQEEEITLLPDTITSVENSPTRFDIPLEASYRLEQGESMNFFSRRLITVLRSNIANIKKALKVPIDRPEQLKTTISPEEFSELRELINQTVVSIVGFTKLPRSLIFKDKAVMFENAIVLAMEMDKEKMLKAPSKQTQLMVMETYNALGIAANEIADYLRNRSFAAQASHPLGGLVLYPPLAKEAGMGWIGKHGLLITQKYGPRMRLAAVFTSIRNLPFSTQNEHQWVEKYCDTCGICIRNCPPEAILETPLEKNEGRKTCIDRNKCFPYFLNNYSCSICIKVCPFNTKGYEVVKGKYDKK